MNTAILVSWLIGVFVFITTMGHKLWCWIFKFWPEVPAWIAAPEYWVFTACWIVLSFMPLLIFGALPHDAEEDELH